MGALHTDGQASLCRFQNCLVLLRELHLENVVTFKVYRAADDEQVTRYLIVVHVLHDYAFAKYAKYASCADMPLFRGMFLSMELSRPVAGTRASLRDTDPPAVTQLVIQQAFLPKFENEAQDADTAARILEGASSRYMVVTIKHSGSLATLSADLIGAKNSVCNQFTTAALLLLRAHFQRVSRNGECGYSLAALLADLRARSLSVSFEAVCYGLPEHGQIPAGDYIVTTSICHMQPDGQVVVLPWTEQLDFCLRHRLPVNDVWLFTADTAAAARSALDEAALSGVTTSAAIARLDGIAASSASALRVPGTYPHAEWQGTRIEGFVVAQGDGVGGPFEAEVRRMSAALQAQVLHIGQAGAAARCVEPVVSRASTGSDVCSRQDEAQAAVAALAREAPELACLQPSMVRARRPVARCYAPEDAEMVGGGSGVALGAQARHSGASSESVAEEHAVLEVIRNHPLPVAGIALASDRSVVSRAALLAKSPLERPQLLDELMAGLPTGGPAPVSGGGPEREHAAHSEPRGGPGEEAGPLLGAVQRCCGALVPNQGLRYKKKMMMYSLASGGSGGHTGYCMMTFLIRNGLRALRVDKALYLKYVESLVNRWRLDAEHVTGCMRFAKSWAAWIEARGGVGSVRDGRYLDAAEAFAADFVSGCLPEVATSAFRGVVLAIGFDSAFLASVQDGAGITGRGSLDRGLAWSRSLPEMGYLFEVNPVAGKASTGMHPKFEAAVMPWLYIIYRPPPRSLEVLAARPAAAQTLAFPDGEAVGSPGAKRKSRVLDAVTCERRRLHGQFSAALVYERRLRDYCRAHGIAPESRILRLHHPAWVPPALLCQGDARSTEPASAPAEMRARNTAYAVPRAAAELGERAADEMVQRVVRFLGRGAPKADDARTPTVTIVFAGIPGSGKTTLAEALVRAALEEAWEVVHHHSDALQRQGLHKAEVYWPRAAECSIVDQPGGRPTVVIADKNLLPSPKGNWEKVARVLRQSGAPVLALLLTDQATCDALADDDDGGDEAQSQVPTLEGAHGGGGDGSEAARAVEQKALVLPFTTTLVALAVSRVVRRTNHVGKLDQQQARAARIHAAFAGSFRGVRLRTALRDLRRLFGAAVPIPVVSDLASAAHLPPLGLAELLRLVEQGCLSGTFNPARCQLGDDWEVRIRALVREPRIWSYLESLAVPVDAIVAQLVPAIQSALSTGAPLAGLAFGYIAVSGFDRESLVGAFAAALRRAGEAGARAAKGDLHVTLWHFADARGRDASARSEHAALGSRLLAFLGQPVDVEVIGFLVGADIAAASVRLLSAPEFDVGRPYLHITLWHAPGIPSVKANELPLMQHRGEPVLQMEAPPGLVLRGTVTQHD